MVKLVKLPKSMWKEDNALGLYYPTSNRIELLQWKYLIHELLHYLVYKLVSDSRLRNKFNKKIDSSHVYFRSFTWRKKLTIQYNVLTVVIKRIRMVN